MSMSDSVRVRCGLSRAALSSSSAQEPDLPPVTAEGDNYGALGFTLIFGEEVLSEDAPHQTRLREAFNTLDSPVAQAMRRSCTAVSAASSSPFSWPASARRVQLKGCPTGHHW